jgi:tRNA (guanosine-2'-O-)-methyltransferase
VKALRTKTEFREFQDAARAAHPPRVELAFLLQDLSDAYNVGGLFRVADACGAKEMYLTGKTPMPEASPMIPVTSMGHHRRIPHRHFAVHEEAAMQAVADGWTLVAVELAEGAECYSDFAFPARTCLVLGNEQTGTYPSVLKHCTHAVFIPMYGKGKSMNVHVSAAVVAFVAIVG